MDNLEMLYEWREFAYDCLTVWKNENMPFSIVSDCRDVFFPLVELHIKTYVIPQYLEKDVLKTMTKEKAINACDYAIAKYIARKETHVRSAVNPVEKVSDCCKRAHYAQLRSKYMGKKVVNIEDADDVYSALIDWLEIKNMEELKK